MDYRDLQINKISFELFIKAHRFTLKLPKYEMYELGSQIRRAADSVNSNIVEGYGRRRYKHDFVKFLTYSHASNTETLNHFKKVQELYPEFDQEAIRFIQDYDELGGKIYNFIDYVLKNWRT